MMTDETHTRFTCDLCNYEFRVDLTDNDKDGLHDIGDGRDLCAACFCSAIAKENEAISRRAKR